MVYVPITDLAIQITDLDDQLYNKEMVWYMTYSGGVRTVWFPSISTTQPAFIDSSRERERERERERGGGEG